MHRCWLGEIGLLEAGGCITLSAQESAHVARVLRMHPGDAVQLIAAEALYAGTLENVDLQATTVRVLERLPAPECETHVTLVQGLPKLDKLETVIQKATELGVWDVMPVAMERSVARVEGNETHKRERWERIVLEAAKQSGRAHVPQVHAVRSLPQTLQLLEQGGYDAVYLAWEEECELRLSEALRRLLLQTPKPRAVAIVIGPEGGVTPAEAEQLRAIGATAVTLGPRILRTETAGLCALSVTMGALGEM